MTGNEAPSHEAGTPNWAIFDQAMMLLEDVPGETMLERIAKLKDWYLQLQKLLAVPEAGTQEPVAWRCFHCDEVFTDPKAAANHFGVDHVGDETLCQMAKVDGGIAKVIADLAEELQRYRSEDSTSYREFYALGADHRTALVHEEQKGYDRGLADARAEHAAPASQDATREAREKEITRLATIAECAALVDSEVAAITKAGDQFDKGGDIYSHASVLQGVASCIRALASRADRAVTAEVAQWMIRHGYVTGHGDTLDDLLGELVCQVHANALLEAHKATVSADESAKS